MSEACPLCCGALRPTAASAHTGGVPEALRPFLLAACVGWAVEQQVADAKPRLPGDRPLIPAAVYAGHYAAQSRVSWADWKRLLDAAEAAGLLNPVAGR